MFIVSIHIPKTAGTTMAAIFDRVFDRRVIYDYDGYAAPASPSNDIFLNKEFIQRYFRVLHGHFYAEKYFDVFPNAAFIPSIRHPVHRIISQYLHELNEQSSDAWYHADLITGKMDIVDFASQSGIKDALTIHLKGREIREYDMIVISENILQSARLFAAMFPNANLARHFGDPLQLPKINQGSARGKAPWITVAHEHAIFDRTNDDNEIYAEAMEHFIALSGKWLPF